MRRPFLSKGSGMPSQNDRGINCVQYRYAGKIFKIVRVELSSGYTYKVPTAHYSASLGVGGSQPTSVGMKFHNKLEVSILRTD